MKQKSTLWAIHLAQRVSIRPVNSTTELVRLFGAYERAEANARLIVAATNAAKEANPKNPIAAAEALPSLLDACKGALAALDQYKTFPADVAAAKKFLSDAIALAERKEAS